MVLVPACTTFASHTAYFSVFHFHFFLSLIAIVRKANVVSFITLFALYGKKLATICALVHMFLIGRKFVG